MTPAKFRALVWRYYREHGRHELPWRATHDLYRILVSEVMLQQTQVDRVIPLYKSFIKKFPTAKKLADAPLSEVLKSWQGLGYNRRAKMLHDASRQLVLQKFTTVSDLETLPGVGPYTARAIVAFVYNQDSIVIETNIRTVIIHHFFSSREKVSDTEIEEILRQVHPNGKSREWYSALMDYGAYLKHSGISHNARSTTHSKQSKFTGSLREVRGAILRELAVHSTRSNLVKNLEKKIDGERREQIVQALDDLCNEGLLQKKMMFYALAD